MGLHADSMHSDSVGEELPVQFGRIDMQKVLFGSVAAAFMLAMVVPSVARLGYPLG
jgi:hypothetical protein